MFDNLNITKAFKLTDNITGNEIEIATFNAVLTKGSNINVFMNINYPRLYETNKDNILIAYREFNAEVSALACTMGLAESNALERTSTLQELEPLKEEFKEMAVKVFSDVIASLGDIQINPVPYVDYVQNQNNFR